MYAIIDNELPIFVIPNVVLLPNAMLPLHIFEQRYRRMIEDCMKERRRFVLVNGDSTNRLQVGCVAEIVYVSAAEGGASNVLVAGRGRARILEILTSQAYPSAVLGPYEDEDAPSKEVQEALHLLAGTLKTYASLLRKVFNRDIGSLVRLDLDAEHLSFIAACLIDLPAQEQQQVLSLQNTRERLLLVDQKMWAAINRLSALSAIESAFAV